MLRYQLLKYNSCIHICSNFMKHKLLKTEQNCFSVSNVAKFMVIERDETTGRKNKSYM